MTIKISDYDALTSPASGDLLEVVDVSDTTMAATGTNKKITYSDLLSTVLPLAGGTMTGTITSTIGTVTASTPVLTATQTFNNAAVNFEVFKINAVRTATGTAWVLMDLQSNGGSLFKLGGGDGSGNPYITVNAAIQYGGAQWALDFFYGLRVATGKGLFFSSTASYAGTLDLGLTRNAAGVAEFNNGTAGTFRDLKLRSLIMTQGSGSVIILPSSDPGVSGALWNNGGTIAISA